MGGTHALNGMAIFVGIVATHDDLRGHHQCEGRALPRLVEDRLVCLNVNAAKALRASQVVNTVHVCLASNPSRDHQDVLQKSKRLLVLGDAQSGEVGCAPHSLRQALTPDATHNTNEQDQRITCPPSTSKAPTLCLSRLGRLWLGFNRLHCNLCQQRPRSRKQLCGAANRSKKAVRFPHPRA